MSPVFLLSGSSGNVFLTNVSGKVIKVLTKLAKPTVSVSNKIASWGAIANCNEYYIRITTDSGEEKGSDSTSENHYSLSWLTAIGTYFIYVTAIGDKINFSDSDTGFYSYTISGAVKLATPTGLRISDGYMHWDSVPFATQYIVNINGYDYTTSSSPFLLPTDVGTYNLKVQATAIGTGYSTSDFSITEIYTVTEPGSDLNMPIIDTRTQLISIEDVDVWQGVFSFYNPNQASVTIEYNYDWNDFPVIFDYAFNNVGFYTSTTEVGVANNSGQTRTLYIAARIRYAGNITDTAIMTIQVQA